MTDVLGKLSFLATPDVNGSLVLTELSGVSSLTGTANQISVTGTLPAYTIGLSNNAILPGTESLTMPSGTTAQRPPVPVNGMLRYNTTLGNAEYWSQSAWRPVGQVVQIVHGSVSQTSSNVQIPFDTTAPLITEGLELWSVSFTPLYSNSLIIIQSNQWTAVNSASDVVVTGALFRGTTCINSSLIGWSTNTNDGSSSNIIYVDPAGSTSARTYSFRAGPNINATIFYNRGVTATLGGTGTGQYIITEFVQ